MPTPLSTQVVAAPTPFRGPDIAAPMIPGIHTEGTGMSAIESSNSATIISAGQAFPAPVKSVLPAVVSTSQTSGTPAVAIGNSIGQSTVLIAENPATASRTLAPAANAAAAGVRNAVAFVSFNAANASATINGQSLAVAVASCGTRAQQIAAVISATTNNNICAFGAGGLLPGLGTAGASGINSPDVGHALLSLNSFQFI
jgi:hypothetical protein